MSDHDLVHRDLFYGQKAGEPYGKNVSARGAAGRGHSRQGRWRPSGFPTANLELEPGEHLPKERGVYASFADIDGQRFVGVTNIGTRPTVDSSPVVTVETWFPDYQGDLYGRELRLTLTGFLRGIHRFENLGELKAQIDRDSEEARRLLADWETKEK